MGIVNNTYLFIDTNETVTKTKLNDLAGPLVTEFNGRITDDNIDPNAAILASKLDLASPGVIGDITPSAGTFTHLTSTGNTIIGDNSGDAFTINPSGWTLSNNVTITGTWADLGEVTTVDINGGTLSDITIDGNWTAASQTCADLGSVTTVDINGGTINGTTIGGDNSYTLTTVAMALGSDSEYDLYYRDLSGNLVRLAFTTEENKVLRSNGTSPEWGYVGGDYSYGTASFPYADENNIHSNYSGTNVWATAQTITTFPSTRAGTFTIRYWAKTNHSNGLTRLMINSVQEGSDQSCGIGGYVTFTNVSLEVGDTIEFQCKPAAAATGGGGEVDDITFGVDEEYAPPATSRTDTH